MNINTELISTFMQKYGITKNKLSTLCNISRRHTDNLLKNSKNTTLYTIYQVAKLMQINIIDLINQ